MTKRDKKVHFTSIDELVVLRQSKDINEEIEKSLTIGEKMADALAGFAGSWFFIIFFAFIIGFWVFVNAIQLKEQSFDPYPFILLNLILSMIAALQAPIIMMSQNRQEDKDRIRSELDYNVNLKAEILIEEILIRLDRLEKQNKKIIESTEKNNLEKE